MQDEKASTLKYCRAIFITEMKVLQMDNSAGFRSVEVAEMLELFGILLRFITARNKQSQGKVEQCNRMFQTQIRLLQPDVANHLELEYYLHLIAYIINCRVPV